MQTGSPSRSTAMYACLGALVFVLVFAVSGGIAYLVLSRTTGPAMTTFTGKGYTFEYPETWSAQQITDEEKGFGTVLKIADGERAITVYDFDTTSDASTECSRQAAVVSAFYDNGAPVEDLGKLDADGKPAYHLRMTGKDTAKQREQVQDMYCMPRPRGVVQISAIDASANDRTSVAEAEEILKSWHWS